MLSFGMFSAFAFSTANTNEAFMPTSPPPSRAATVMSRDMRAQILERLLSAFALCRLILDHLL